jgi:hypothetical protein
MANLNPLETVAVFVKNGNLPDGDDCEFGRFNYVLLQQLSNL